MLLQEEIRTPVVDLADEDLTNDEETPEEETPAKGTGGSEQETEDLDYPTGEDLE